MDSEPLVFTSEHRESDTKIVSNHHHQEELKAKEQLESLNSIEKNLLRENLIAKAILEKLGTTSKSIANAMLGYKEEDI